MTLSPDEWEKAAVIRQQERIRERRATLEPMIKKIESMDDADLLYCIRELARSHDHEVEPVEGGTKVLPSIGLEILCYVGVKRGLLEPSDEQREFCEWIDRELSHPGGPH